MTKRTGKDALKLAESGMSLRDVLFEDGFHHLSVQDVQIEAIDLILRGFTEELEVRAFPFTEVQYIVDKGFQRFEDVHLPKFSRSIVIRGWGNFLKKSNDKIRTTQHKEEKDIKLSDDFESERSSSDCLVQPNSSIAPKLSHDASLQKNEPSSSIVKEEVVGKKLTEEIDGNSGADLASMQLVLNPPNYHLAMDWHKFLLKELDFDVSNVNMRNEPPESFADFIPPDHKFKSTINFRGANMLENLGNNDSASDNSQVLLTRAELQKVIDANLQMMSESKVNVSNNELENVFTEFVEHIPPSTCPAFSVHNRLQDWAAEVLNDADGLKPNVLSEMDQS
jgi:hypothetical protein